MKNLLVILMFVGYCTIAHGQSPLSIKIDFTVDSISLEQALVQLSKDNNIGITFSNDIIPASYIVQLALENTSVKEVLNRLLESTELTYKTIEDQIVIYKKTPPQYTISGYVEDQESGEKLISANIYDPTSERGSTSNVYGFYSISLPRGATKLQFSYLGYQTIIKEIDLQENTDINISLEPSLTLSEVVVVAPQSTPTQRRIKLSSHQVYKDEVDYIPSLGGELDLIRVTHLLPGIQSGTDGAGGIHVRGGNVDQNLILLDGVPVYNPYHAIGLYSVFNTNAIRSAELIKGSFPARYGGRLSSILDVRTKEGNNKTYEAEASVGILASNIAIQGPIKKNKSSFLLSARRTHLDPWIKWFTKNMNKEVGKEGFSLYSFYDLTAKLNHSFSRKDQIFLSFYKGGDDYHEETQNRLTLGPDSYSDINAGNDINWGNTITAFRWNHLFSRKLFANTTLTYSKFEFKSLDFSAYSIFDVGTFSRDIDLIQYRSKIQDWAAKIDFEYIPVARHFIRFGVNAISHDFSPGVIGINEDNDLIDEVIQDGKVHELDKWINTSNIEAYEYAAYLEDDIKITKAFKANMGIYTSLFAVQGKEYFSVQPRVSASYLLTPSWTISASYSQSTQFLHLLTNSGLGLPNDLWIPSTANIKPQEAWQADAGLEFKLKKLFDIRIEGYYKKMNQLLTYQEGASFLADNNNTSVTSITPINWEQKVSVGEGQAYGAEFLIKRRKGKTTGWISYTLSWSDRKFEHVNFGERYPFKYDRRHLINLVAARQLKNNMILGINWTYGSGNPSTLPLNQYLYEPEDRFNYELTTIAVSYGKKNSYRMPAYHRLDLNITINSQNKRIEHIFNLGLYNVYNRKNPFFYRLKVDPTNGLRREIVKVTLLPILPSINYTARF